MSDFSEPPDFLFIEEKLAWKLVTHQPVLGTEIQDLINRANTLKESVNAFSRMVHNSMEERKLIMDQLNMLQRQNADFRQRLEESGSKLKLLANQITSNLQPDSNAGNQNPQNQNHQPIQQNLYRRIHFGRGPCPPNFIPIQSVKRSTAYDKNGQEIRTLVCPNCDAEFTDRRGDGRDSGLRTHLSKFKCRRLRHLKPASEFEDQNKEPKKKKKKSNEKAGAPAVIVTQSSATDSRPDDAVQPNDSNAESDPLDNELEGLVVEVIEKISNSGSSRDASPVTFESNKSLQNLMLFSDN